MADSSLGSVISCLQGSTGPLWVTSTSTSQKKASALEREVMVSSPTDQMPSAVPPRLPQIAVAMRPPSVSPAGMHARALTNKPAHPASISELTCTMGSKSWSPRKAWAETATSKESVKAGLSTPISTTPRELSTIPMKNKPRDTLLPYKGPAVPNLSSASLSGRKPLSLVMPPKDPRNPNPAGTMNGRYISASCRSRQCPTSCATRIAVKASVLGRASMKSMRVSSVLKGYRSHWMMGTLLALSVDSSVNKAKVAATQFSVNLLIRSEPAPFGSNATVGLSSRSIKRNRVYWSPSCSFRRSHIFW
mmetsp:Transcript_12787/g.34863  ORF Transcript_12787/g.34863 Transcript_12787/m.34863 type:complete len:305 (-) Transcript_12787:405-1319(-)